MRISDWSSDVCSSDLRPAVSSDGFQARKKGVRGDPSPSFRTLFPLARKGPFRVIPWWTTLEDRPLFGCFRHGVDRHIFAAKLAIVESDLAVGGCEQRVVLAHADVDARIDAGAALAHDNVAADHFLTAELLHAKAEIGRANV